MTKIYIHRSSEWANAARNMSIYIDDKKVGSVQNGMAADFDVEPGTHTLEARIDWCSSQKVEFTLAEGEHQKFELSSFKMFNWMTPVAILAAIIYFVAEYFFQKEYTFLFVFIVPIFMYFLYHLTFGRKHYLLFKKVD